MGVMTGPASFTIFGMAWGEDSTIADGKDKEESSVGSHHTNESCLCDQQWSGDDRLQPSSLT
jgi:hypothetical protein